MQPKTSNPQEGQGASGRTPDEILARLSAFLDEDFQQVDGVINETLRSQVHLTNEVAEYLQTASGKRLRPMLTLLTSRLGNRRIEAAAYAAALTELIHVASLLHDDVIDHAPLRRGRPTVNARWNNEIAILMADYLYSRGFHMALESLAPDLLAILARAASAMCDAEMFQIEKRDAILTEEDYLFIIRCKTAELFSACAQLGARLADLGESATDALGTFGREFGCAFQITDDVLDLTADPERLGKEIGTDIGTGKQTLPMIHALAKADDEDRLFLLAALNDGRPPVEVFERVVKYGGIEYALDAARQYAQRARECLGTLADTPARSLLCDLTELVVNRTY